MLLSKKRSVMPYLNYKLPEYPCEADMWDRLQREERPIVVYGMGNGADKLFRRLEKYGVSVADVFASDGFVRGHSFRGYRVKSFSEIKSEYRDFVILLSFASSRGEVIDMLKGIDGEYEMYIPDMPIADEEEYFDRAFYNLHYGEIVSAYESLADEESRAIYSAVINYRLTGRLEYLLGAYSESEEIYSLIKKREVRAFVDVGAYRGDTLREAVEYFDTLERVYAIEPDKKNFKKLSNYAEALPIEVYPINAAAWSTTGVGSISESGNRNSTIQATASFQHTVDEVSLATVDSLVRHRVDYIKYDVEGAELEALVGSRETIEKYRPTLLVSLYHRSRDIFYLTEYLSKMYNEYNLYIRRTLCIPAWEINLIMIPKEVL